jgi:DNA-binding NtrC family response regulator
MPGLMDGIGLARWISHHHPGVHVILTSAISHAARAREIAVAFVPKPYRLAELALLIRSLFVARGKARLATRILGEEEMEDHGTVYETRTKKMREQIEALKESPPSRTAYRGRNALRACRHKA